MNLTHHNAYSIPIKKVVQLLDSDQNKGLSPHEATNRLSKYGENCLPQHVRKTKLQVLLEQLDNPILYILALAAVLTYFFGDLLETITVCIVIIITLLIGFFMELSALRSLELLRSIGQMECRVIRSGKIQKVPTTRVVPGDILMLGIGDVIAADIRLTDTENLEIKEGILTGESIPVSKHVKTLGQKLPTVEQKNMAFKGTIVSRGNGKGIVVATGPTTVLGNIQSLAASTEESGTPLDKKLNQLGRRLIYFTLAFIFPIILMGIWRGIDLIVMVEIGIALAVATIPEGLPVVVTIALARGMLRLSKKQVVIKRMEAVEVLGSITMVASDKTGTLTEDNMLVDTLAIDGNFFRPLHQNQKEWMEQKMNTNALEKLILTSTLCNDITLGTDRPYYDSIDLGLLQFVRQLGKDPERIRKKHPELYKIPFDENRKFMVTVNQMDSTSNAVFVKGAFEKIAPLCSREYREETIVPLKSLDAWRRSMEQMSSNGLRTIAMAYKTGQGTELKKEDLCNNLIFLGLVGFMDPARDDVKQIMDIYEKAGIRVVMMTGDHPKTAQKIAVDIGLLNLDEPQIALMEGNELERLDIKSPQSIKRLLGTKVFARVTPQQKLNLVTFFQKQNNVIGMFGDGVNDVPALIKSDIGIAMGKRGTEAAREAADIILKDDRFAAVALAIRQGRVIFDHIRQFLIYLLSCNLAEIIIVGVAALLNITSPLLPLQILFLNLVTDIFPALALGFGKGEDGVMEKPPRNTEDPIMTALHWKSTILYGLSITISVLGITIFSEYSLQLPPQQINNLAFYTLIIAQLLHVFNMPSRHAPFIHNEVTKNPWIWGAIVLSLGITLATYFIPVMARALSLVRISWSEMGWPLLFGGISLIVSQCLKRIGITC
ncbi:MAG: cation-transporting P-type ATPase [Bacteroidota bacterium]|uniref:Cation-transporting P-type ATPase n=1 Tax=Flagellimonas profundi TaxID=2915620 RepID=A0ABS3FC79_9FLAO|nr:cation-transporting P-type ATPase [Allomuricauda profundi]MBO0340315.1 cation-transporting P-type ATPase [Allomuricauda profundi]MEC7771493.1 cation-transporting P-type ATPase [Bacteroidota bacterium]